MFDKNNLTKNDLEFIKYNAVAIYKLTDEKDEIIQTKEQIFCDQLTDTIDEMVETDNDKSEEYINKINKYLNNSFCKN